MALGRIKVYCSRREVVPIFWAEASDGTLFTNEHSAAGEKAIQKSGEVTPPSERFPNGQCQRKFTFTGSYPQKGIEDNERFWDATPSFDMTLTIANAGVDFEVGRHYYLDFVRINPADQ